MIDLQQVGFDRIPTQKTVHFHFVLLGYRDELAFVWE